MQAGVVPLILDVMPIYMIIAWYIVTIICFSINCSAVICLPTVIFSILREASNETYGLRVYFPSYEFPVYNFSFLFTSFAIFYCPFHKPKIPKILLYRLPISIRSHFANNREGIDNPFITLGASWCLFVQVQGTWAWPPTGLIPWFSKLREILTLFCCITLSSSRKKPTQA